MANNTILMGTRSRYTLERTAAGTITPGDLCTIGSADTVTVNAGAADADPQLLFALEDQASGNGIDDDYASGDGVVLQIAARGDLIYATLDSGESVATGAALESAGNGHLQAHTTGAVVAHAAETVDASSESTRIKVRAV